MVLRGTSCRLPIDSATKEAVFSLVLPLPIRILDGQGVRDVTKDQHRFQLTSVLTSIRDEACRAKQAERRDTFCRRRDDPP